MMKHCYTFLATLLIALVIAATETVEQHEGERRIQSIGDIGDIFSGLFGGSGFFVCDVATKTSEPVQIYIYFFYLVAGIVFNVVGGGGGTTGFLGKTAGKC